jgi:dihydroxyacetone kinase
MELMIAARKAVPELQLEYGIAVDRVYTGTLMTSLDMAGQFLRDLSEMTMWTNFVISSVNMI